MYFLYNSNIKPLTQTGELESAGLGWRLTVERRTRHGRGLLGKRNGTNQVSGSGFFSFFKNEGVYEPESSALADSRYPHFWVPFLQQSSNY